MKIYVSGASAERERYRRFLEVLPDGVHVNYDWATGYAQWEKDGRPDLTEPHRQRLRQEMRDAIRRADAFVLLVPEKETHSKGCWLELGWADAYNAPIFMVKPTGPVSVDIWDFCAPESAPRVLERLAEHAEMLEKRAGCLL